MLFFGEEVYKKVNVLFGGEKVCCMLLKVMFFGVNILILDELINYLDLEFIIVFNNGLISFKGVMLFIFYDYQFVQIIVNRIIEIIFKGIVDK